MKNTSYKILQKYQNSKNFKRKMMDKNIIIFSRAPFESQMANSPYIILKLITLYTKLFCELLNFNLKCYGFSLSISNSTLHVPSIIRKIEMRKDLWSRKIRSGDDFWNRQMEFQWVKWKFNALIQYIQAFQILRKINKSIKSLDCLNKIT